MATKTDIEWKINRNMTNAICIAGANIATMRKAVREKKYIGKKVLNKMLDYQMTQLKEIEKTKDEVLNMLKEL